MKTPREILLQRHDAATPKLDAIRRAAVRELNNQKTNDQNWAAVFGVWSLGCLEKLWLELVWPCRRTWAGLAAVWVALAVFNAVQAERGHTVVANTTSPATMRLAFQEQQQILAELIGQTPPAPPAAPPHRPNNQPRSEKRMTLIMV